MTDPLYSPQAPQYATPTAPTQPMYANSPAVYVPIQHQTQAQHPGTYGPERKQVHIAYILLIFFGIIGVHKFYLGKVGMGILYIFTWGLFGIGTFIDIFTLNSQTIDVNRQRGFAG